MRNLEEGVRDYPAELREHAFDVWYKEGCNDSRTVKALDREGYGYIARKTIAEWREKFSWQERAARLDEKRQTANDTALSFDEEILQDLLKNKEHYKRYFESLEPGTVDNQASYVYLQMCKQIRELRNAVKPREAKLRRGIKRETADEIKRDILGL